MEEIKKAFTKMKKSLEKETGLCGGFTMSGRQIANRTATYLVCNDWDFDYEISYYLKSDEKVQGYSSWTAEEKENSHERTMQFVSHLENLKKKYGTKMNQAKETLSILKNSKAFADFQKEVGETELSLELKNGCYYIRFHF